MTATTAIELSYAAVTLVFIAAGLTMVGKAVRAYVETTRTAMLHLSVGFSLAVVGSAATLIGAFYNDFEGARSLLLVKSSLFAAGFLFVIYSLEVYE